MKIKNKRQSNIKLGKKHITITAIGHVDMELIFNISDELMARHKIEWEKLNSAADLEFLDKDRDFLNNSIIQSQNSLLNCFLYLNKTSQAQEKFNLEFSSFNEFLKILQKDEEKFLKNIFKNVTELNNLIIHENEVLPESKTNLIITIKNNKQVKSFQLRIDQEGQNNINEKLKISDDLFQKININNNTSDYVFLNLEDFLELDPDNTHNILNLMVKFLQSTISSNERIKIILNYSNVINQLKSLNLKTVESIIQILSISDILMLDKEDVHSLFNLIYQVKESHDGENLKQLPEKELTNYIYQTINFERKNNKVWLFFDNFQKINILEISPQNRKIIVDKTKELHLYPKINHTNQKVVEEYKQIIQKNYKVFRSIFFGGFLSKYLSSHVDSKDSLKVFYSSHLAAMEITKKILECTKNKIDLPSEKDFYLVKISPFKIDGEIQKEGLKTKEDRFVLDCNNQRSSRMKYYHPLFDGHLNMFFSSEINRQYLKDKGFINTNGFIMYDGIYRDVMGPSPKKSIVNNAEKDSKEESKSELKGSNSPINRKLPLLKFEYFKGRSKDSHTAKGKLKLKPIKKLKIKNKNRDAIKNESEKKSLEIKNETPDSNDNLENKNGSSIDLYSSREKFAEDEDHIREEA